MGVLVEYKNWEKWALTFGKDTIHTDVMAFLSAKKEFRESLTISRALLILNCIFKV